MRKGLAIALTLSVLGNLVLIYRVFDLGVTLTYGSEEISRRGEKLATLEKLLPLLTPNTSRAELLSAAKKADLEILEKQDEGVYVGGVQFLFSNDQIAAVKFE